MKVYGNILAFHIVVDDKVRGQRVKKLGKGEGGTGEENSKIHLVACTCPPLAAGATFDGSREQGGPGRKRDRVRGGGGTADPILVDDFQPPTGAEFVNGAI